jgi:thioredoxin
MVQHLTNESFKEKVFNYTDSKDWKFEGNKPAVIDFYADWCGPCKMVAPILDELATEFDGKIDIYKVDTETERELAGAFGIQSIHPSCLSLKTDNRKWHREPCLKIRLSVPLKMF